MGDNVFEEHFREMTQHRTSSIFNKLAVDSQSDALAMLRAYKGFVAQVYSINTVSKHKGASLCDLPCQACELGGVLGAIQVHRASTHERGASADQIERANIEWLLARLPADIGMAGEMRHQMLGFISSVDGKGD
eukprot:11480209-Alexandrium_andersonii.AAC.1